MDAHNVVLTVSECCGCRACKSQFRGLILYDHEHWAVRANASYAHSHRWSLIISKWLISQPWYNHQKSHWQGKLFGAALFAIIWILHICKLPCFRPSLTVMTSTLYMHENSGQCRLHYKTVQIWGQCTSRVCWSSCSDCSANLVYESCDKTYSSFTFLLWRWNTDGINQPVQRLCFYVMSYWWNSWLKWNLKIKTSMTLWIDNFQVRDRCSRPF